MTTRKEKRTWLKVKRIQLGLSQSELANMVSVATGTISNIETGDRSPSGEVAYKISKALQFDMTLFYEEEDSA